MFDRKRNAVLARTGATAVLGAGLIGAGIASAQNGQLAKLEPSLGEVKRAGNVECACTGVGDEMQNDPRWARYPAKFVFTVESGDYLSDVAVKVTDANTGEVVYDGGCKLGPWLVMDLAPGRYNVTADAARAESHTATVDVGNQGQTTKTFIFSAGGQT